MTSVISNINMSGLESALPSLTTYHEGYTYFATDTLKFYRWSGLAWVQVAASVTITGFIKADGSIAFTGDQSLGTHKLTNVGDPASAQDAATKAYVDAIAINLGKRDRVRAATTANITISTALNNGDTLDGVSLVTGDLVLVKNQSAPEDNGIYVVGVSPARFSEYDSYNEHPGSLIAVQEGTANADTAWLCTSNVGGTLGSTAINYAALSTGGGVADDLDIGALSEESTPASGDMFVMERGGTRYKVDFDNLGAGGAPAPTQVDGTDISGCILWLDADQESGSEGDAVATIQDFSASNNDATQATGANKPTLRLNAANGRKGWEFDGVNDFMQFGSQVVAGSAHTLLVVYHALRTTTGYNNIIAYKEQAMYSFISNGHWGFYRNGDIPGGINTGNIQVAGYWGASNSDYYLINGTFKRKGTVTNSFETRSNSYLSFDSGQYFSGLLCEVRLYDNQISAGDLLDSINWLLYKWRY